MLQPTGERPLTDPLDALSAREREVLGMVALGLSNQDVAARLLVSVHAVKFHLAGIYRKLGVSNRTEAALVYVGAGGRVAGRD
jgi:ATP/maltotriose-dependent transcriptional regulator MalT